MSPSEIVETWQRSPSLSQAQVDRLVTGGVPPLALARDPGEYGFTLAVDSVVFNCNRFDFARDLDDDTGAAAAMLIAARDEAGDIADIVAARPSGGFIGSWLGRVCLLGQQNVWAPRLNSDALAVHSDVIAWLVAGRHGVVIIDAERAQWALADAGPLLANSIEHGRALRSALTFSPDILIPTNRKLAA